MPHPSEHSDASRPLSAAEAEELAGTLQGLSSAGRLRLLLALFERECTVDELATAAELGQSATSHHLRLLRALRLVRVRREGRHAYYALHNRHVADLLAAIRHHHEHLFAESDAGRGPLARRKVREE
jgi:DNA-binding transcriptional ArsR family regulator